jgi:hypothetical protein
MTTAELLAFLRVHDIRLTVTNDRLRVDAPTGVLTPDVRAALVREKAAFLTVLAPVTEFVSLKGGLAVPRPALELVLTLERRGFSQVLDARGEPDIQPDAGLTDMDRLAIYRWRRHLVALIAYDADAVSETGQQPC